MMNIKFTLRNFITVVGYLHCPLEHMYYSFYAVETNNKTLDQGCEIDMQMDYTNFTPQDYRQCFETKIIMLISNRTFRNIF